MPLLSVRGHPLYISPDVSHLFCFPSYVSLPGVSWPTSSPLPWGVPCDGLKVDGSWRFPQWVSYPLPFLLFISFSMGSFFAHFQSVMLNISCLTTSDSAQAFVDEGLYYFSVFYVLRHVSDL